MNILKKLDDWLFLLFVLSMAGVMFYIFDMVFDHVILEFKEVRNVLK